MTLGNKIKLKREQAGMSQQDLAEKSPGRPSPGGRAVPGRRTW